MVVPWLVHFPEGNPRVVMHTSEVQLAPGDELVTGWVITRHDAVDPQRTETDGIEREVWVTPRAA